MQIVRALTGLLEADSSTQVIRLARHGQYHDPHLGWAVAELCDKHVQYANAPFVRMLRFEVTHLSGWSASSS